jgi:hypothetical protein
VVRPGPSGAENTGKPSADRSLKGQELPRPAEDAFAGLLSSAWGLSVSCDTSPLRLSAGSRSPIAARRYPTSDRHPRIRGRSAPEGKSPSPTGLTTPPERTARAASVDQASAIQHARALDPFCRKDAPPRVTGRDSQRARRRAAVGAVKTRGLAQGARRLRRHGPSWHHRQRGPSCAAQAVPARTVQPSNKGPASPAPLASAGSCGATARHRRARGRHQGRRRTFRRVEMCARRGRPSRARCNGGSARARVHYRRRGPTTPQLSGIRPMSGGKPPNV